MNKRKAFIPITALMAALLLALVAAMTPFVAEPNIAYAQASGDATLQGLTVVGQPTSTTSAPSGVTYSELSPVLDTDASDGLTTVYDVRIPFDQTGVLVTPDVASGNKGQTDPNDNSIIRVNGTVVAAETGHEVSVANVEGAKATITIHVTAPQRTITQSYTVRVYREHRTRSNDANLASLGISGAGLSPSFSPGTTSYKARAQAAEVTLSYGLSETGGGASVGDVSVTSDGGGDSYAAATKKVTLGAAAAANVDTGGTTTITVPVTAEDGSTKSYSIVVYRIRANRATNANLATLTSTPVGGSEVSGFTLDTDASDGTTLEYTQRVNNATTHVTIAATKVDAGAMDPVISPSDAQISVTGHQVALRAGAKTTITVRVTAEDTAVRQTYTLTVYRNRATLSSDNNLNSLGVSVGSLDPLFNRNTTDYDVQVGSKVEKITVSYTASDTAGGSAVVVGTTTSGASVANNKEVTLAAAGSSTAITVTVTPETGTSDNKVYNIDVYRLRSLPSADASLSSLTSTPATTPALTLVAGTKAYNVEVAHNISAITVTAAATAAANGATVAIRPSGGTNVALAAGAKTAITITVTAEDRTTTDTYMVYVYRQRATPSDDATLSELSLSAGMLMPIFSSDTVGYKARVESNVDEVTVTAMLNDSAGGGSVAVTTPGTDTNCNTADDVAAPGNKVSPLSAGGNTTICVTATAENNDTKVYTITVYRLRDNPNTDATLSTLSLTETTGTITDLDGDGTVDTFDSDGDGTANTNTLDVTNNMNPDVVYRVRQVTVNYTADIGSIIAIMPADANAKTEGHQVDLTAGAETMITVTVQPEDSTVPAVTHTLNVYRMNVPGSESKDATLSSLMLSGGMLTPEFASGTAEYTAAVAYSTAKTTVTAMTTHIGANFEIGTVTGATFTEGTDADGDMDGWQVALAPGQESSIVVEVTAEDGTTKRYTVKATRAATASSDASLSSLSLMAGMDAVALTPAFDADTMSYTAMVGSDVEMVTVSAMPMLGATVEGAGDVDLEVGENTVTITVTAEDAETTMTYTVMVTREILTDEARLLARYDANNNGMIDRSEAVQAIRDHQAGTLSRADAVIVIRLYQRGG